MHKKKAETIKHCSLIYPGTIRVCVCERACRGEGEDRVVNLLLMVSLVTGLWPCQSHDMGQMDWQSILFSVNLPKIQ